MSEPTVSSGEGKLIVIVRAPNQEVQDYRVECPYSWSVRQLKEHLQESYLGHPAPVDQKLIYSGQLMEDAALLKEVLRQDGSCFQHTVHLVCRPSEKYKQHQQIPVHSASSDVVSQSIRDRTLAAGSQPASADVYSPQFVSGVQYHSVGDQHQSVVTDINSYAAHVLALRDMYAQYYQHLIIYQQAIAAGVPSSVLACLGVNNSQISGTQQPLFQIVNQQVQDSTANRQQDHQRQQVRNNNNRVNNEANDVNDGPDWLEYLFEATRAFIIGWSLSRYVPLDRFYFFVCLGMLIFLYQQGRLRLPRAAVEAAPPPLRGQPAHNENRAHNLNRGDEPQPQAAQDSSRQDDRPQSSDGDHQHNTSAEDHVGSTRTTSERQQPQQSSLAAALSLLRAFLVSLIPDNQNQL